MKIGISTAVSFLIIVMLYLALSMPKINHPVTDDEIYEIHNAELILARKPIHLFVPPVYDCVLAGTIHFLGNKPWALRIPGILSSIASIGIAMLITFSVFPRRKLRYATVTGLLLATNPAFVQGSLLIHIDNTVLVPAILLWLYYLLDYLECNKLLSLVLSGLLFAVALLIKFSTPTLIVFAITPYFITKNNRRLLPKVALVLVLSYCAFLAAWAAMASVMNLSFWGTFSFVGNRVGLYMNALTDNMAALVQNVWTLSVWFTPYILLLFVLLLPVMISAVVSGTDRVSVLSLASAGVLVYLVISTINHGFPKYLMPCLPLLVISTIYYFEDDTKNMVSAPVSVLMPMIAISVWFLLVRYDTIYALRFSLREVLIAGLGTWAIAKIPLAQAVVWFLPLLAYLVLRLVLRGRTRFTLPEFLLILLFSHGFTLSVIQNMSSYQTNYSYGETGTMDMHKFLTENARPYDRIFATKDILHRLGRDEQYISRECWSDKRRFLRILEDPSTRFLVTSIPSHSLTLHKSVLRDKAVQSCLQADYRSQQIGTFTIHQRMYSNSSMSR